MPKHDWSKVTKAEWYEELIPYFYRRYSDPDRKLIFELIPAYADVPEDAYDIVCHNDFLNMYLKFHGTTDGEDLSL